MEIFNRHNLHVLLLLCLGSTMASLLLSWQYKASDSWKSAQRSRKTAYLLCMYVYNSIDNNLTEHRKNIYHGVNLRNGKTGLHKHCDKKHALGFYHKKHRRKQKWPRGRGKLSWAAVGTGKKNKKMSETPHVTIAAAGESHQCPSAL